MKFLEDNIGRILWHKLQQDLFWLTLFILKIKTKRNKAQSQATQSKMSRSLDIFAKKTLRCSSLLLLLEKCKSKPQWGITSHWSEWPPSKSLKTINAGESTDDSRETVLSIYNDSYILVELRCLLQLKKQPQRMLDDIKFAHVHSSLECLLPDESSTAPHETLSGTFWEFSSNNL